MALSKLRCAGPIRLSPLLQTHPEKVRSPAEVRRICAGLVGPTPLSKVSKPHPQRQGIGSRSALNHGLLQRKSIDNFGRGRDFEYSASRGLHRTWAASTSTAAQAETSRSANPTEGSSEQVEGATVTHQFVNNGGVRIHYVEAGDPNGKLAVLLHGWPSFWYSWVYQIKALTDAGYHVVIPDMRGYNLSGQPSKLTDYGREPCCSDVKMLIEKTGKGRPAVLIAHDWGGAVAWAFVRSYPQLVSRLIALNIPESSTFAEAIKSNQEQQKKSWYIAFFQLPFLPEFLLSRGDYKGLKAALGMSKPRSKELLDRHVEAFSRPGALTSSINYYRASGRGHWKPPGDSFGRVELPVKVIWGEEDIALSKDLATPPKDLVPDQQVVFLPGVSHWCMWDDPETVNKEILNFAGNDS